MPPTINKYLQELNDKLKENDNFFYIYRGLPSKCYNLSATALRDPSPNPKPTTRDLLKEHQKKLLDDSKIKGFGRFERSERVMHDLELLADLRHYSAPSCLIDFTSNFLVSLWFACEKEEDKDGKIFISNCYETDRFLRVSHKVIGKEIDYFFDDNISKLWYWIPERINPRLTNQNSVFIFGEPSIKNEYYKSIEVQQGDKKPILEELEKFFDYSRTTLFSDKYALGDNYKNMSKNSFEYNLELAVYYIQTNDFKKAEIPLKTIIKTKDIVLESPKFSI